MSSGPDTSQGGPSGPGRTAENSAALILVGSVIVISVAGAAGAWRVLGAGVAVGAAAAVYLHWPRGRWAR